MLIELGDAGQGADISAECLQSRVLAELGAAGQGADRQSSVLAVQCAGRTAPGQGADRVLTDREVCWCWQVDDRVIALCCGEYL